MCMEEAILHFSRRKYYKTVTRDEIKMHQELDKKNPLGSWVKQCDGKTEEECNKLGFEIDSSWMTDYKRKIK